MNTDYIYVGYADHEKNSEQQDGISKKWQLIPNTKTDIENAISDGYTALDLYSMSKEPIENNPEPLRKGDLVLDFDCKDDYKKAIYAARFFVESILKMKYNIDPALLRYWITGGKGCHISIPAELYGGEEGDPYLPVMHKMMVFLISRRVKSLTFNLLNYVDFSLYCMGKGKLLRLPNIIRNNGRYKVPVTADEFFALTPEELFNLTENQREHIVFPEVTTENKSAALSDLYQITLQLTQQYGLAKNKFSIESLFDCDFITHCFQNQEEISEPQWWTMITIFKNFGDIGSSLIHIFSKEYPNYSYQETEKKIETSKATNITCDFIHNTLQFTCTKECNIASPLNLWRKELPKRLNDATMFDVREDGLYYLGDHPTKLCSYLKFIAKACDEKAKSWSRVVEIKTPNDTIQQLFIPIEMICQQDEIKKYLMSNGVELCSLSGTIPKLIVEYIQSAGVNDNIMLLVKKNGWLNDDTYILPEKIYGNPIEQPIYYLNKQEHRFYQKGTLEEWKEKVAKLCHGNPILMFSLFYSFTPIFLRKLSLEGIGIHIYGASSTGKSTAAIVAGSVWGGSSKGYHHQWRATHNALELIAAIHNDAFLVLDEISQATPETIYHTAYMLANGQGKSRLKSDATSRESYTWMLNFLSTGELKLADKIEEDGRHTSLAGQNIRILDIPMNEGNGINSFPNCHEFSSANELSDELKRNGSLYYGTAIDAFLNEYVTSPPYYDKILSDTLTDFESKYTEENCSGQVKRVLRKFALIAGAGEIAIDMDILPFKRGDAFRIAEKYFEIWIQERGGVENAELINMVEKLQEYFAVSKRNYIDSATRGNIEYADGLHFYSSYHGCSCYFAFTGTLKKIFGKRDKRDIIAYLDSKGYIMHNENGKIMETKSYQNQTYRGLGFLPAKWEDTIQEHNN